MVAEKESRGTYKRVLQASGPGIGMCLTDGNVIYSQKAIKEKLASLTY